MKIFVTGVNGQLGFELVKELIGRGMECIGSDIQDAFCRDMVPFCDEFAKNGGTFQYLKLDITDSEAVEKTILGLGTEAVIHPAGWTAVDAAEDPENVPKVYAVNETGTSNLAKTCKKTGSKMIFISTDYVFDGSGEKPWDPDCRDYNPLSVYGSSKLAGEKAVSETLDKFFIVRISWAFGLNGNNFVRTMLRVAENHDEVRVVDDQIGTPTYMRDLAVLLSDMIMTDKYGYYHASNEGGYISWYDFTKEIYRQAGINTRVVPVSTAEYGVSKARRPMNSRLDKSKLEKNGFKRLPDWRDALKRYIEELKISQK